jgi:hypothetical protein
MPGRLMGRPNIYQGPVQKGFDANRARKAERRRTARWARGRGRACMDSKDARAL